MPDTEESISTPDLEPAVIAGAPSQQPRSEVVLFVDEYDTDGGDIWPTGRRIPVAQKTIQRVRAILHEADRRAAPHVVYRTSRARASHRRAARPTAKPGASDGDPEPPGRLAAGDSDAVFWRKFALGFAILFSFSDAVYARYLRALEELRGPEAVETLGLDLAYELGLKRALTARGRKWRLP